MESREENGKDLAISCKRGCALVAEEVQEHERWPFLLQNMQLSAFEEPGTQKDRCVSGLDRGADGNPEHELLQPPCALSCSFLPVTTTLPPPPPAHTQYCTPTHNIVRDRRLWSGEN